MHFDLGRFLPYLLNRAGSEIAGSFAVELKPYRLSLQKWRMLAALHHAPEQRVGTLAEFTSIDVWTVSRLARRLENQGLVERLPVDGDGRGVCLRLSAKGRAVVGDLVPIALKYEAAMFAGFSEDERAVLRDLLVRAHRNMTTATAAGRAAAAPKPVAAAPAAPTAAPADGWQAAGGE